MLNLEILKYKFDVNSKIQKCFILNNISFIYEWILVNTCIILIVRKLVVI